MAPHDSSVSVPSCHCSLQASVCFCVLGAAELRDGTQQSPAELWRSKACRRDVKGAVFAQTCLLLMKQEQHAECRGEKQKLEYQPHHNSIDQY